MIDGSAFALKGWWWRVPATRACARPESVTA